jgi:hypothetical protein
VQTRPAKPSGPRLRGRVTYANVAATLALVLAMSGGALAAGHYLIHSTKQISPAVLKKLHGARGARGPSGVIGSIGPQGPAGEVGAKGRVGPVGPDGFSALSLLPGGASESGDFTVSLPVAASSDFLTGAVSFPIPLTARIAAEHVVFTKTSAPVERCAGPGQASRGYLCIYIASTTAVENAHVSDPEAEPVLEGSGRFGFTLAWTVKEAGPAEVLGTYTVTAP